MSSNFFCSGLLHLGKVNMKKVCECLKDLGKPQIVKVGVSLGLYYENLYDLNSDDIPHNMVHMWLIKQDNVIKESGTPTWRSLIKALQDNDFNGNVHYIKTMLLVDIDF